MAETLINGYHLLQLCGKGFKRGVTYSKFRNNLGEGFRDTLLFGSNTGLREFSIEFPTLPNYTDNPTYEIDGVLLSAAEYLFELYHLQETQNKPIVVQDRVNNQYYLCEFIDPKFTLDKAYVALFSNQSVFQQIRISGVSVFDVSKISRVSHWYKTPIAGATDNAVLPDATWINSAGGEDLTSANCTYQTNEHGDKAIVRLDQSGTSDFLSATEPTIFYEAFLLMKVRETTFAEHRGIISNAHATDGSPALIGNATTTKFFNLGFGANYEYRLNGTLYAESNQQAPMNAFGLVHIRNKTGWTMPDGIVFGRDRHTTYPERDANLDFEEIILASALLPESITNEIYEAFAPRI